MKIGQRIRDWWDSIFMPPEEKRGNDDSVKELLRLKIPAWRSHLLHLLLLLFFGILAIKLAYLQLGFNTEFLQKQGAMRFQRTLEVPAQRGQILDRNGQVLAASVPAKALWIIPQDVNMDQKQIKAVSSLLGIPVSELKKKISSKRSFAYLKRQVPMDVAEKVLAMKIPGIHSTREFLRSYPEGVSAAQIVGLTGLDGNGIEGIELSAEKRLAGKVGSRRVLKDRLGRVIEDAWLKEPLNGENITLTIDSRLQSMAYEALERQVTALQAKGGSVVIADPQTGDILALANYPSFDPNKRSKISRSGVRNRAVVDTYEPGSTMKPFSVAAGLEEKKVTPDTLFQIGKSLTFGRYPIGDSHYSKELTVSGIIQQSSNIGTSKIALLMSPQTMWGYYDKLGFGKAPKVGFPGAVSGRMRPAKSWRPIEQATMSYGHGITVSLLQQVRAYTSIARNGDVVELSIYKDREPQEPQRVFSPKTAAQMRQMLARVVEKGGTGTRARVEGYTVAGKTGTAYKVENGIYVKKYVAGFAGYAPAHNPRIVVGIMIDEPMKGKHYGSTAAAPLFSEVVLKTLHLMAVNPDRPEDFLVASADKSKTPGNSNKDNKKKVAPNRLQAKRTQNAAKLEASNAKASQQTETQGRKNG